jgi:hypothetical protein
MCERVCRSLQQLSDVERKVSHGNSLVGAEAARKFDNEKCRDALRPLEHVSRCQVVISLAVALGGGARNSQNYREID